MVSSLRSQAQDLLDMAAPGSALWSSRRRDDVAADRLQKFWSELPRSARRELLRIDKQTLLEHARRSFYCSRCHGLLLESFTQIVMYGKSILHSDCRADDLLDPAAHPWGGLVSFKDGVLTLLDCYINARSLRTLQNAFDNARSREHDRELLYPDACGGGGRGWISQGIVAYGRGHGSRESCALHTARLSCDTLVDFWSALSEDTQFSLLRMKEEDFIERLMYRFESKRFCRDCRRNVIREYKELKELKRMKREPRCTSWFCVPDTMFEYELYDDTIIVDWHQSFGEADGMYHHFEWAVGSDEGKSDIVEFKDVGMSGTDQIDGIDLLPYNDCFITLRAWKHDGRYSEFCVKAHALDGQSCVHRRLMVGDGYVAITKGESIRRFFEHAEEAEEDDDDTIDSDGNDIDGDGAHPQKHAKSPELAREFLVDAATVIFKEQIEKAFREGTARQNAHSVFVSLALSLLEERVHIACKEIITLEKQTKLLEEEEQEKREEEERKERRRVKEKEKKLRRKERLKEKEREREQKFTDSRSSVDEPACQNDKSGTIANSRDLSIEHIDDTEIDSTGMVAIGMQSSGKDTDEQSHQSPDSPSQLSSHCIAGDNFELEISNSAKWKLRSRKENLHENSAWFYSFKSEYESCRDLYRPQRERFNTTGRMRDKYESHSCSCGLQDDQRKKDDSISLSGRSIKEARRKSYSAERSSVYSNVKHKIGSYFSDGSPSLNDSRTASGVSLNKSSIKRVLEPRDARKRCSPGSTNGHQEICDSFGSSECQEYEKNAGTGKRLDNKYDDNSAAVHEETETTRADSPVKLVGTVESISYNEAVQQETNSVSSAAYSSTDSGSSCLSEGDNSTTTSSARTSESSSSSDSEESLEKEHIGVTKILPTQTSPECLPDSCTGNQFKESEKEVIVSGNGGHAFNEFSPQQHVVHQESVQLAPLPSTAMSFHNQNITSWAVPPYVPFPQPGYPMFPGPVAYAAPAARCVNYSSQYNTMQPFVGPSFGVNQQQHANIQYGNFQAKKTVEELGRGAHLKSASPRVRITSPHKSENTDANASCELKPANRDSVAGTAKRTPDGSSPFSLFHFGVPAAAAPPGPPDGASVLPAPAESCVPTCSMEEMKVKEYNLFSTRSWGAFSFR